MGNECCSNCNVGAKQRELQDNAIKDSTDPKTTEQLPSKFIEEEQSSYQERYTNQKVVTNSAPEQSQRLKKQSINGSTQIDRRTSAQNGSYDCGAEQVFASNSKQQDQNKQTGFKQNLIFLHY